MNKNDFSRKALAAARVVLLIAGLLLGGSIPMIIFNYAPTIIESEIMRLIIILSCGAVFGVSLMLTARPIALLTLTIARALKRSLSGKHPMQIVGYIIGIAFGLMASFVGYVVLAALQLPQPLIICLTFIFVLVLSFVGALICSRWLSSKDEAMGEDEQDKKGSKTEGYILTAAALAHEKVRSIVGEWLLSSGVKVVILQRTLDTLSEELLKVCEELGVKPMRYIKSGEEREDIRTYAAIKKLAVITADEREQAFYAEKTRALCLNTL